MLTGFYTAASGLLTQQRNINVIGNNMTNAGTPGYRGERVVTSTFDQDYLVRVDSDINTYIGTGSQVTVVEDVPVDYNPSSLKESTSPFDCAIVGEGYFNIQGEERVYITRNGNFDVDTEGYLILPDYGRVIGKDGFIQTNGSHFTVHGDGTVVNENDEVIGQLEITVPAENTTPVKYNNALFYCEDTVEANEFTVYQNTLERSNIDMNQEYTRLMEAQQAFKACSNALTIVDTMNAKAAQLANIT